MRLTSVDQDDHSRRRVHTRSLVDEMLRTHSVYCRDPECPFTNPKKPFLIAKSFAPVCDGNGGWKHRNLYGSIGWIGEYLAHLAVPDICLHGGIRLLTTPMDGNSPRGEAEIKTATACAHGNGERRRAFTIRMTQRRDHALPLICVSMDEDFLPRFAGSELSLPSCAADVAEHIEAVFVIPLGAYPTPAGTFVIPDRRSAEWRIRSIQTLFRCSYEGLRDLGLDGLCRIRALFDSPAKVRTALRFIEVLGPRLTGAEFSAYQRDPHRLLSDAEAFKGMIALNGRVAEAIALVTLSAREQARERELAEAERELLRRQKEHRERTEAALRMELAFALLGILTLAAERPISAMDMRHRYGLRRDTAFPPQFNVHARERGIAVCLEGERNVIRTAQGARERRLTKVEKQVMASKAPEWVNLVASHRSHLFASEVLKAWQSIGLTDRAAARALRMLDEAESGGPHQLQLFGAGGADGKSP